MKNKILITGYPHTGTTILKSKFGEAKNVYEVINETFEVRDIHTANSNGKQFVLVKSPIIPLEIRVHGVKYITTNHPDSIYKDYIIVFITRNPWNLFTSIIKVGDDPLSHETWHLSPKYAVTVEEYFVSLERFIEAQNGNFPNIYTIKYEELFEDNFSKIKSIMNSIGLDYDDDIFETQKKVYKFKSDIVYNGFDKPDESDRNLIRTWQINQPFQNMNKEVDIPDELDKILKESPIIKELGYSDPRITH